MSLAKTTNFACIAFLASSFSSSSHAFDLSDTLSIEGTATGVVQQAELDNVFDEDGNEISDTGRGSATIDIGVNFHPTDHDEFQLTYSFAEGTAINGLEAFTLAPFADDLEEDLSDINSSGRYNLLEAWYKHTFEFCEQTSLGVTVGIIGSTGYIDDNEYANDEISQFMNDIFVNNTLANLPDYDTGAALEFASGAWTLKAVVMNSENDDDNGYHYYAVQIGRLIMTPLGEGNYRVYAFTTDNEFVDTDGSDEDKLTGFGISIDQQLSESVGLFARLGTQDDDVPVDHDKMISVGLSIAGNAWNRSEDTIGIGVAFLDGASDSGVNDTTAAEAYYKFVYSDHFDLSLDVQWIDDDLEGAPDAEGLLAGLRLNANF